MNMSDDTFDWVPVMVATFLVFAMAAMVHLFAKASRRVVVSELNIYPIKSCGPMNVTSAQVTPTGFAYDRFAQVSDSMGNYLTPRVKSNAKLFHVRPEILTGDDSVDHLRLSYSEKGSYSEHGSEKEPFRIHDIKTEIERCVVKEVTPMIGPKVKLMDLGDDVAKWLSDATEIKDCRLTAMGSQYSRSVAKNPGQGEAVPLAKDTSEIPPVSLADEAPFLLTTVSSLEDLNARLAVRGKDSVDMQRFRPNIVVHGTFPWEEDTWKRIKIGDFEFRVWQRCGRCTMTTIDPKTLERGPEPLSTLSTFRERSHAQRNFGMHMIPVAPQGVTINDQWPKVSSLIEVGHTLEVLEYDKERLSEWKRLFE